MVIGGDLRSWESREFLRSRVGGRKSRLPYGSCLVLFAAKSIRILNHESTAHAGILVRVLIPTRSQSFLSPASFTPRAIKPSILSAAIVIYIRILFSP